MTPICWIEFLGPPVRLFYGQDEAIQYLDSKKAKHKLLDNPGVLRQAIIGENANITLKFRNENFEITKLWSRRPPFGQKVNVYLRLTQTELVFSGVVQQIDWDDVTCTLVAEA